MENKDSQNNVKKVTLGGNLVHKIGGYFKRHHLTLIIAIIGWGLAAFLFIKNQKTPGLTFLENTTKSIILEYGKTSNLQVSYNNIMIDKDISIAQIAIWNNGNEAILPQYILDTIKIMASPYAKILETNIRKTTRKVINLSYSSELFDQGIIPISWGILERGDGGIFEIIYIGTPKINFHVEGVIQGQKKINQFKPLIYKDKDSPFSVIVVIIIMMIIGIIFNTSLVKFLNKIIGTKSKFTESLIGRIIIFICDIAVSLFIFFLIIKLINNLFLKSPFPPWGSWS